MSTKIHFITGGQRSGKSAYGEKVALSLDDTPTYLATSKHWDEEFSKRIHIHQERRNQQWITIEESLYISKATVHNKVIFLDCITLWLANVMEHFNYNPELSYEFIKKEWTALNQKEATIIAISNEIGMGVIPMESATRKFVDLQGKVNQYIAEKADKVDFVVSGIPIHVKS